MITAMWRGMRTGLVLVLVLVLVLALIGGTAAAEPASRRVALVIGNGGYRNLARLANPTNDATLIAETLTTLGFVLVGGGARLDLDKPGFDQAVQEFGTALQSADVGLFYYAGHGLQMQGVNWLVPVGANPSGPQDVDFQMVDADLVLKQMQFAQTKLNIVILDACRNNPFGGRGLRATGGGLAEMRAPKGTLIAYATQPGAVARDGAGGNSPFTQALAANLVRPGVDVFRLFNQVGLAVQRQTGGDQQPWVASSPIEGDFYFAGAGNPNAPAPQADPDLVFWQSIAQSSDPSDYRAYVAQFPQGRYAELARRRMSPPANPGPVPTTPGETPSQPPAGTSVGLVIPPRTRTRPSASPLPLFLASAQAIEDLAQQGEVNYLSYLREFDADRGPTGHETSVNLQDPFSQSALNALDALRRSLDAGGAVQTTNVYLEISEPEALPPNAARGVRAASLPDAAQHFIEAADALRTRLNEARPYYDHRNYLDDHFARGRAMHPGIIAAYREFLTARLAMTEALRELADAERERYLSALPAERRQAGSAILRSLAQGRHMVRFIAASLDAAPNNPNYGPRTGKDPRHIDVDRLKSEIDLFERSIAETRAFVGNIERTDQGSDMGRSISVTFFLKRADEMLEELRYYWRSMRDGKPVDGLYFSFRTGYESDIVGRFDRLVASANQLSFP